MMRLAILLLLMLPMAASANPIGQRPCNCRHCYEVQRETRILGDRVRLLERLRADDRQTLADRLQSLARDQVDREAKARIGGLMQKAAAVVLLMVGIPSAAVLLAGWIIARRLPRGQAR